MNRITLSNGLTVSEAALGAMDFGSRIGKEDAFRVLDAYVDAGGNFIDTSNNYAHWRGTGDESELLLGEWLSARQNREKVVIATKVGFDRHGTGAGLKKEQIEYWIDESLRKLKTDYVDLYYAHTDDPDTPIEETMEAFGRLVEKGKIRALGGSNYDTWRFAEACRTAENMGLTPYTVMQQRFSYLYVRSDAAPKYIFNEYTDRERLRFLKAKNLPLVAYSCLCKGGYEDPARMPADYIQGSRMEKLLKIASEKGVSASMLVLKWLSELYRLPDFPRVIPLFTSSPAHIEENLKSFEMTLSDEELAYLTKD